MGKVKQTERVGRFYIIHIAQSLSIKGLSCWAVLYHEATIGFWNWADLSKWLSYFITGSSLICGDE